MNHSLKLNFKDAVVGKVRNRRRSFSPASLAEAAASERAKTRKRSYGQLIGGGSGASVSKHDDAGGSKLLTVSQPLSPQKRKVTVPPPSTSKKTAHAASIDEIPSKFTGTIEEELCSLGEEDQYQLEYMLYISEKEAPGMAASETRASALPEKMTIQEEKETLKRRLAEIDAIEMKSLENLMKRKKLKLEETKEHFRKKLETAFAEIEALQVEEAEKCIDLEKDIGNLATEISNKKKGDLADRNFESCLECPICLDICKPPIQVWQCPEGHILCGSCATKPEVKICPQCRVVLAGQLSRSRVLEEVARKIFPG